MTDSKAGKWVTRQVDIGVQRTTGSASEPAKGQTMTSVERDERADRRHIGLQLAQWDLSPPLEFLGLGTYVIQSSDVGLQVWDIIRVRVDERIADIERERESDDADASGH